MYFRDDIWIFAKFHREHRDGAYRRNCCIAMELALLFPLNSITATYTLPYLMLLWVVLRVSHQRTV